VGSRPTLFDSPTPPRITIALAVSFAIVALAGSVVTSLLAATAAVAAAVVTWRFDPLVGGIVAGAFTAVVVLAEPQLVPPMSTTLVVWVIILEVAGMVTGMIARRESNREADAAFDELRATAARRNPTPVRGTKQITGEMAPTKQRSNPEIQALKIPPRITV